MTNTNERYSIWLKRLSLGLIVLFPFSFALYYQVRYLSSEVDRYQLFMLAPIVIVFFGFLVFILSHGRRKADWTAVALVIGCAIATRLAILMLLSTDLVSDVLDTHLYALDVLQGAPTAHTDRYTYIPEATYLNMTGLTFAAVYKIFGASVRTAKLFMVFFSTVTCGMLFQVGKELGNDQRVGLAAALLFAAWPSLVSYTGVPSGEHMAMFLIILVSMLWIVSSRSNRSYQWGYSLVMYALIGATVGLVDWFRPLASVLLVAIVLSYLLYLEKPYRIARIISHLAVLVVAYYLVSVLSLVITEKMHMVDLPSSWQRMGHSILIGVNVKHKGLHNQEDHKLIADTYANFDGDYNKASLFLLRLAFQRVIDQRESMPALLQEKFSRVWQNDNQLLLSSLEGSNDQELMDYSGVLVDLFLTTITFLALLFTISVMKKPPAREVFMMLLFICGIGGMLLVTEAQMRYRAVIMPYLFIIAGLCLQSLLMRVKPPAK